MSTLNLPRKALILIRSLLLSLLLSLGLGAAVQARSDDGATYSAEALRADLETWQTWLMSTHPDLAHSTDLEALAVATAELNATLNDTYSTRDAWMALSTLNPIFRDAHTGMPVPSTDAARTFIPVVIDDGIMRVANNIATGSAFQPGEEILAINGEDAREMIAGLMPHMRGETELLQAYILQLKFDQFLHFIQGERAHDCVTVLRDGAMVTLEIMPGRDLAETAAEPFNLTFDGDRAILKVDTFDRELEAEFLEFLPTAFQDIADHGSTRLTIDISVNGGGARQLSDPLLAYITDQRYTPISAVQARITPENQALIPGSQIGQVIATPYAQWVEPAADLANRFTGEVDVVIGRGTYSQAIMFATIVQDFGLGRIVGTETEGPANQTGQVQTLILPNTGLEVRAPIYIFTRASGTTGTGGVMPD
jgi:C-terminal processing protease CtpA/Prc